MRSVIINSIASLLFGIVLTASTVTANENPAGVKVNMVGAASLVNAPGNNLTAVTVELSTGLSVPPHQHAGFAFVYVLEGTIRSQLNTDAVVDYSAGES